ncbi:MAG: A/G-specific adenine glycosylase [Spirochaetales bacterium]|nr:A/G-specific adenine glycosylase [Spirochaetales bacterium]
MGKPEPAEDPDGGGSPPPDPPAPQIAQISHRLIAWFLTHKRELPWREESDPYRVWISEVMLQQTRSQSAAAYYLRWLDHFPDIRTLAAAPEIEVLKAWEGLGYYGRARNLHRAARLVVERHAGELPADPAALRALPGIGEYTAAAVASIAFARPTGVVDGNVVRVVSRLLADSREPSNPAFRRRMRKFVESSFQGYHPGWINQAWMELGALVCLPQPQCAACPLAEHCRAFQERRTAELPARRRAAAVPVREGSLLVVLSAPLSRAVAAGLEEAGGLFSAPGSFGSLIAAGGSTLLLVRRPARGLLGGLWEFPNFPVVGGELRRLCADLDIAILSEPGVEVRHRYSHFEARFRILIAAARPHALPDPLAGWEEQRWVRAGELSHYPRPQVHIKAMQRLGLPGPEA